MARSVILEVRKAVIDGIRTELGDPKVSVTYGWQGGSDDRRREQVFTRRARAEHGPAAMKGGRLPRNEELTFEIVVEVLAVAAKLEDSDERALEIGRVVEEFIADRKSGDGLDVDGLNWIYISGFTLDGGPSAGGDSNASVSQLIYTVRYNSRLD